MQMRKLGKSNSEVSVPFSPMGTMDESTAFDSADFCNPLPRFTPEARKANQALVDLLTEIIKRKNATPAQIVRARLLAQEPWTVPIPSSTKQQGEKEP